VLDERPEERARGVTVDVAQARFETGRFAVTLLDAPGHRDFVPNMISGAAQADAALLLVDGSPGGFEAGFAAGAASAYGAAAAGGGGGQTREHAQLARSLGIEQLAVVVTKLDTVPGGGAAERFLAIQDALLPFLKACGFREAGLQWLPAVGPAGDNLVSSPAPGGPLADWWAGPTVVGAIDAFAPRARQTEKPLRLPISDVFRARSGATVAGGKIEAGAVRVGGRVVVVPSHAVATVKGIEVGGAPAALARAGDNVELTLAGVDTEALRIGSVLCPPDFPVPLASRLEARVLMLDVPVPLLRGASCTLHCNVAREDAVVSGLLALLDAKSGETTRARPRCLARNQTGLIEVTASRPLCAEAYADVKALGRVTLREGGRTIAVGIVTRVLEG
jgi:elongation factor 1 alpha-like protein